MMSYVTNFCSILIHKGLSRRHVILRFAQSHIHVWVWQRPPFDLAIKQPERYLWNCLACAGSNTFIRSTSSARACPISILRATALYCIVSSTKSTILMWHCVVGSIFMPTTIHWCCSRAAACNNCVFYRLRR